jgi:hypothetical protein
MTGALARSIEGCNLVAFSHNSGMIADLALALVAKLIWVGLMGIGQIVYDYQTLIAGIGAIGAAIIAVRPVYHQLDLMRTQSNAVLKDLLLQRQAELEQAAAALKKHVSERLDDLGREYPWYEVDEDIRITERQAHHFDLHISGAVRWIHLGYRWRDNPVMEGKKALLVSALDELIGKLGDIYFTASHQQHDEDYSIDNEEWVRLEQRGEDAKLEIYPSLVVAKATLTAFLEANQQELVVIDTQLRKLDQGLLSAT